MHIYLNIVIEVVVFSLKINMMVWLIDMHLVAKLIGMNIFDFAKTLHEVH